MKELNHNESRALAALRAHAEGSPEVGASGATWRQVYLDNAMADLHGWSRSKFAGVLSSLTAKGFYKSQGDDCFGDVLITNA